MKYINIKELFRRDIVGNVKILIASITLIYLIVSLYFMNHFFFNTVINGVDVSLKDHAEVDDKIIKYVKDYRLQLIERNGEEEEITGQDIGLRYNRENNIYKIYKIQSSFKWPSSLLKTQKYFVKDLYHYDKEILENRISQ